MTRFSRVLALLAICFFASNCYRDWNNDNTVWTGPAALDDCTPLYVGCTTVLEEVCEKVTLYATETQNEYYIPYFFMGNGELTFKWDRTTNLLSLIESYTGLFNVGNPIYVISQSNYRLYMDKDAKDSFYDPATQMFTFNVMFETASETGTILRQPTVLYYQITGVAE